MVSVFFIDFAITYIDSFILLKTRWDANFLLVPSRLKFTTVFPSISSSLVPLRYEKATIILASPFTLIRYYPFVSVVEFILTLSTNSITLIQVCYLNLNPACNDYLFTWFLRKTI